MTYLTRLAAWVAEHRDTLEQHGQVKFALGPSERDNPSAHLLVVLSADSDVELLLWESGDAEFNRGPFDASIFEHLDLVTPEELDAVLRRFLAVVVGEAP